MIDVLLSTCNGEKYLGELFRSLAAQDHKEFRILIRDDGSRDGTLPLIREFIAGNSCKVVLASDTGKSLGVVQSFGSLLRESTAPYVMFADQDDIWHPRKLSVMAECMRKAESLHAPGTPLLLHSDLRVCGERGELLAHSHVKSQRLSPERNSLAQLCVQNCVTGCAMMINRPLRELVRLPFPQEAVCHDWYLALVGSAAGKVIFTDQCCTDYRQHKENLKGHVRYCLALWGKLFLGGRAALDKRLQAAQKQTLAFVEQYGDIISAEERENLLLWGNIKQYPKLKRLQLCLERKFRKNTFLRNLGMWWSI